jgi:hypothetical protein
MRTTKYVTGRLARWAMKLSTYQIEEIKYRPGKTNTNADSLSRNPLMDDNINQQELSTIEIGVNIWEGTNILNDIKAEQQTDSKFKPINQRLETNTPIDTIINAIHMC